MTSESRHFNDESFNDIQKKLEMVTYTFATTINEMYATAITTPTRQQRYDAQKKAFDDRRRHFNNTFGKMKKWWMNVVTFGLSRLWYNRHKLRPIEETEKMRYAKKILANAQYGLMTQGYPITSMDEIKVTEIMGECPSCNEEYAKEIRRSTGGKTVHFMCEDCTNLRHEMGAICDCGSVTFHLQVEARYHEDYQAICSECGENYY